MSTLTISPLAHRKLQSHSLRHPTCAVHGVLLGRMLLNPVPTLQVFDSFPLCHSPPTAVLVEGGLLLAHSRCGLSSPPSSSSMSSMSSMSSSSPSFGPSYVCGWYVGAELLSSSGSVPPPQSCVDVMSKICAMAGP